MNERHVEIGKPRTGGKPLATGAQFVCPDRPFSNQHLAIRNRRNSLKNKKCVPRPIDTVRGPVHHPRVFLPFTPEAPDCASRTTSEQGKIPLSKTTPAKEPSR
jgi:hypothetical protein